MSRTRSRRQRRADDDQTAAAACPLCGAEYLAGVESCSDCHVALVAPAPEAERLASAEGLVWVGGPFDAAAARTLADAFALDRIPHRFELGTYVAETEFGPSKTRLLDAFVSPEDEERASRLVSSLNEAPSREAADVVRAAHATSHPPDTASVPDFYLASPDYTERDFRIGWSATLGALSGILWGGVLLIVVAWFGGWSAEMSGVLAGLLAAGCAAGALTFRAIAIRLSTARLAEWQRDEAERIARIESMGWDAVEAEWQADLSPSDPEASGDEAGGAR